MSIKKQGGLYIDIDIDIYIYIYIQTFVSVRMFVQLKAFHVNLSELEILQIDFLPYLMIRKIMRIIEAVGLHGNLLTFDFIIGFLFSLMFIKFWFYVVYGFHSLGRLDFTTTIFVSLQPYTSSGRDPCPFYLRIRSKSHPNFGFNRSPRSIFDRME